LHDSLRFGGRADIRYDDAAGANLQDLARQVRITLVDAHDRNDVSHIGGANQLLEHVVTSERVFRIDAHIVETGTRRNIDGVWTPGIDNGTNSAMTVGQFLS